MTPGFRNPFHATPPSPAAFSPWTGFPQALAVFAICLFSRLFTTIHYIEDADSLRFALAMIDFDVTQLQPQFPGYPVFCFLAKALYLLLGSYARAFSVLGGAGLFVIAHYALALLKWRFSEARGFVLALLLLFNPMLWLLGNRYMTDLSGAACALAAFYHLTRPASRTHAAAGFFLAGIQAGWRLSFLPFLLVPLAWNLLRRPGSAERPREKIAAGLAGVLAWLIPFVAVTGWNDLMATARRQTAGHFLETGGTYVTEPGWLLRAGRLLRDLWIDGLGAWSPGRSPITMGVSAGAAVCLLCILPRGIDALREKTSDETLRILALSSVVYALWIFVFQNVVNQTRHALPLIPPTLMLVSAGWASAWKARRRFEGTAARALAGALPIFFLAAYGTVGATLAVQHKRPAAIAQVLAYLSHDPAPPGVLVGAPWVIKCLSAQGLRRDFRAVETREELEALRRLDPRVPLVTVGNYTDYIDRPVAAKRTFYHNPYVNRLGSKVEVFEYGPARGAR
jgi:hypothetical protein